MHPVQACLTCSFDGKHPVQHPVQVLCILCRSIREEESMYEPLSVNCPTCKALVGVECSYRGNVFLRTTHCARQDKAGRKSIREQAKANR